MDIDDAQPFGLNRGGGGNRLGLRRDVELAELLSVQMRQPCLEITAVGLAEFGFYRPVFLRGESLDGGFTLADQAQRHRLHTACRARAGKLAPQDRRD